MKTLIAVLFLLVCSVAAEAAQVSLNWTDNSTNETGFKLERKLLSDPVTGYVEIAAPAANVVSYVDSTILVGSVYCFRIKAFNASATSAYSNEACMLMTPSGLVLVYTP
jgi:hypothetical protein